VKPIAITMGDPCGIGPEICVKLFAQGLPAEAMVIGDAALIARTAEQLGVTAEIPVHQVGALPADLRPGTIDARAGQAAHDYVVEAIKLAQADKISAIVTAPLAKESMKKAGISFPGHTEILAHHSGTKDFAMMLANNELRVILVSIHVSLAEAITLVTKERVLKTIRLAARACASYGITHPRIAVAGLNPHAGESGMFGREEIDHIEPAIAAAQTEGTNAQGPFPPDTIFMRARRGEFDIVVCMYHDQGLIPVKYLGIEEGVNVTVGLPFIRTSVDHGTAFDIAGKGIADPSSLRAAFDQALRMSSTK
jgi:4-hydroxythreonine-4-phosphate dehydrogenase